MLASLNFSSNWNTSATSSTAIGTSDIAVPYRSTNTTNISSTIFKLPSNSSSHGATLQSQKTSVQVIADHAEIGITPHGTTGTASLSGSVHPPTIESLAVVSGNSPTPTVFLDPSHRPLAWNITSIITANQTANPSTTSSSSSSSYVRYWWLESCNSTSYASDYPITYRTPPDLCREFDWMHGVDDFAYYADR